MRVLWISDRQYIKRSRIHLKALKNGGMSLAAKLITKLQSLRDRSAARAIGAPNVLPLTVVTRTASGETSLEILPHPTILRVNPRTVALFESTNIKVGVDDFQVSGISAAYTEEQLTGKGKYYIIDNSIKCNEVMGTIDNKSFSWSMILTRMPNR